MDLVRHTRTIYDNYGFKTQILAAAVRHPEHVLQAALAGADVCTMFFDFLKMLYDHPLTDIGLDIFLKDWAKVVAESKLNPVRCFSPVNCAGRKPSFTLTT